MSIRLGDDGTMDTVLVCTDCGQEFRFNYDYSDAEFCSHGKPGGCMDCYDEWVSQCIAEITEEHECEEDTDNEA